MKFKNRFLNKNFLCNVIFHQILILFKFLKISYIPLINKPKEVWKTLRFMGLPSKSVKDRKKIVFDETKNCSIFKNFFYKFVQNLLS